MIKDIEKLAYIAAISGKPIIMIYNESDELKVAYSVNTFKPKNPSNHIHECYLEGCDLTGLIKSISGFSHAFDNSDTVTIMTKLNELPILKIRWDSKKINWVKIDP